MRVPGRNQTEIAWICLALAILAGQSTWAQVPRTFTISATGSGTVPLVQFNTDGDLQLYVGHLYTEQSQEALTPTAAQEFVLRSGTAYLALINRSTGDMRVAGKVYTNVVDDFAIPSPALKINEGTTLKAFITSAEFYDSNIESTEPYAVPAGSIVLTGDLITPP